MTRYTNSVRKIWVRERPVGPIIVLIFSSHTSAMASIAFCQPVGTSFRFLDAKTAIRMTMAIVI